ncbi:MAG TPA: hypothetical protein VG476_02450 [Acidimicrobiales bacterium]|nr:hypothetical protein [Acidimicrobiales bacterium]
MDTYITAKLVVGDDATVDGELLGNTNPDQFHVTIGDLVEGRRLTIYGAPETIALLGVALTRHAKGATDALRDRPKRGARYNKTRMLRGIRADA